MNHALDVVTGHVASAWFIDHLQFGDDDLLDGCTARAYVAAPHPQPTFGHPIRCQSFRNPALLAKISATLHILSSEPFILDFGAGWLAEEYRT